MLWLPVVSATIPLVLLSNPVSSPYDSFEGCREWFLEFVRINPAHCRFLNRDFVERKIYSKHVRPHKVFDVAGRKIKDARYRCDFYGPQTGCTSELISTFTEIDFYMLCQDIDGVEARLIIDDSQYEPQRLGRAYMYCDRHDNHKQLVRERLIAVHQAKKELTRQLGPDIFSCIDSFL